MVTAKGLICLNGFIDILPDLVPPAAETREYRPDLVFSADSEERHRDCLSATIGW